MSMYVQLGRNVEADKKTPDTVKVKWGFTSYLTVVFFFVPVLWGGENQLCVVGTMGEGVNENKHTRACASTNKQTHLYTHTHAIQHAPHLFIHNIYYIHTNTDTNISYTCVCCMC